MGDAELAARTFSARSRSLLQSRFAWTVAVMSIMSNASRPRGPSDLRMAAGPGTVLAVIRDGLVGPVEDADLRVLDPDRPLGARLLRAAEVVDQLRLAGERLGEPGRTFEVEGHVGAV